MSGTSRGLVIGLHDAAEPDAAVLGTKGANLARLAASGFSVPEGFVLTTAACERILASPGGREGTATGADLPEELWAAVCSHLAALGGGPVAVRSSGIAEDLGGASFAGQYETVLGVESDEALAGAIRRCLASASSEQVRAYTGSDAPAPMAVIIQKMVAADAAGVVFTANPVTGDDEVLINAVKGLGDRLVSGEATPDEWVVRDDDGSCIRSPEGALDRELVLEVAALARAVERLFGSPQDIEWAVADGKVFVLQARPITALPVAPNFEAPTEGFWQKDSSHFPTPFTPFGASVYLPPLSSVVGSLAKEFGLLLDGLEQRSLGGEVYMRMVPLGGKEPPALPKWAMWLAVRLIPEMRRRGRAAQAALDSGLADQALERWETEWRPAFVNEVGELLRVDLTALDDDGLLSHLEHLKDLLARGELLHFRLHAPHALAVYELGVVCQELLGWDAGRALQLLTGASVASSEPGRELQALAERIAADPAGLEAIVGPGGDRLARLRQSAPWAAEAFEEYLERYGHRTTGYDPGDPTLFEMPEVMAGLLAGQVRQVAAGPRAASAPSGTLAEARAEVAARHPEDAISRFERALAYAHRAYGQREDNIAWLDNRPCGLLRYCALEFGRRLSGRGVLAHPGDAVFLEESELQVALKSEEDQDLRPVVALRKAERAWVIAHPGPPSYGKPPVPPDLSALPPALRLANASLMNLMALIEAPGLPQEAGNELRGLAVSPGICVGTARVVRDETEFGKLRPGEVLVAPATSPPWSILFLQAAAVVTDVGGVLSHTAVIAREYGIPAVLATGEATHRLCDGDLIRVDGSAGTVSIVTAADNAA
jgi:rifampicin phosphotransferase